MNNDKAVLIFDKPKFCNYCPLCAEWNDSVKKYIYCRMGQGMLAEFGIAESYKEIEIGKSCPLKTIPNYISPDDYAKGYVDGLRAAAAQKYEMEDDGK